MEEYKQNYGINGTQFKKLLSFHIPFINMKTTYSELVSEMLGEEMGILYKQLSLLIHPHDYSLDYEIKDLINASEYIIFSLIKDFFSKYKSTGDVGLEEEYQLVLGNNVTGTDLRELIVLQKELIYKVARVTYEKKLVGFSIILQEFVPLLFDFMLDIMYGYTEHGTTKIKPLMEMLALLDRTIEDKELRCNFDLMRYHGRIAFFNNIDNSKESEYFDNAYDSYREKYRDGINKEKFTSKFLSTLRYLIDSEGNVPSLSFIVKTFIEKYSPNIMANRIVDADKELFLDLYMKMKYEESQILSHANGYMYFTTTGTWVDGINILLFMDDYLNAILERFLTKYKNEDDRDKTIVNVVRNYLRDVKDIIIKKRYFMSAPKINKYF